MSSNSSFSDSSNSSDSVSDIPYSHQISPPLNFRPPGVRKLKGANWEPKLGEGRKLKGTNWAPKIGGAKIKGSEFFYFFAIWRSEKSFAKLVFAIRQNLIDLGYGHKITREVS